jgi:hypothetical protein
VHRRPGFLNTRTDDVPTNPVAPPLYTDPLGLFCTTAFADAIVAVPNGAGAFLAASAALLPLLPPPFDVIYATMAATGAATAASVAPLVALILRIQATLLQLGHQPS